MPQRTKAPSPNSMPQLKDEPLVVHECERKPFPVKEVQVSAGNIQKVAEWCGGTVRTERKVVDDHGTIMEQKYIEVETHQPMNERQKMAYIGDHVLQSDKGYKVYSDRAFLNAFIRKQVEEPLTNGVEAVSTHDVDLSKEHAEGPTH